MSKEYMSFSFSMDNVKIDIKEKEKPYFEALDVTAINFSRFSNSHVHLSFFLSTFSGTFFVKLNSSLQRNEKRRMKKIFFEMSCCNFASQLLTLNDPNLCC